jgi:hypothetical protein
MELIGVGPGGELGDKVELSKELTHHLTGVVPLTQRVEPVDDARNGILGLRDCGVRVVLTLAFQTLLMFEKFFAKEVGETLATWSEVMTRESGKAGGGYLTTTLHSHQLGVDLV